eukprot:3842871-Prymnesium_polylepis.1
MRLSEHLRLEMRSESRGMSVGEQGFASERVSQLCAHGGSQCHRRGHDGVRAPACSDVALVVGVLQGGLVQQQQQQKARARSAVVRARRL